MEKEIETLDSPNEADTEDTEHSEDTEDVSALQEKNKQLFARAKKAEDELRKLKDKPKESGKSEEIDKGKTGFDYDGLVLTTFLISKGIPEQHHDYVKGEAKLTGKPIQDVVGWQYVKEHMDSLDQEQKNKDSFAKGTKRGSAPTKDVDYWIQAGKLPDDPMLRREVVRERRKLEEKDHFYNS